MSSTLFNCTVNFSKIIKMILISYQLAKMNLVFIKFTIFIKSEYRVVINQNNHLFKGWFWKIKLLTI